MSELLESYSVTFGTLVDFLAKMTVKPLSEVARQIVALE